MANQDQGDCGISGYHSMPVDSFEDFAIRLLETTDIPFEDLIYTF
jgi:hypothetical protein